MAPHAPEFALVRGAPPRRIAMLLSEDGERRDRRLVLSLPREIRMVRVDDIRWIESDGNYVVLHMPAEVVRVRTTLAELTGFLGDPFLRIHRCATVHLFHVHRVRAGGRGECVVDMDDGTTLASARGYSAEFRARVFMAARVRPAGVGGAARGTIGPRGGTDAASPTST